MATEQQIDRSVLAGKDRDELHTIAGAIGVKAATRMRKADLIDAILAAANGGESASPAESAESAESASSAESAPAAKPRRVRSARASQLPADDDLAALAAEEDSLGGDAAEVEEPMPRPRGRRAAPAPVTEPDTSDEAVDDRAGDAGDDRRFRCRRVYPEKQRQGHRGAKQ